MASKWMNQVVHLWVLGRLAREQELNEKKCPVHAPFIHGWCVYGCCWFTLERTSSFVLMGSFFLFFSNF
jgi:uncharacterized protein YutD